MKTRLLLIITLFTFTVVCSGQQSTTWEKWDWLIGEWEGEGSGQPGKGGGTFSFMFDLDKKIIVRKSHSEYPSIKNESKFIHDDLMIIYLDDNVNPNRAIYFDNEGHIINYSINYADKCITLTSDKVVNVPVFRLIYTLLDNGIVNTKFEISQDNDNFITYIEGKSKKIK